MLRTSSGKDLTLNYPKVYTFYMHYRLLIITYYNKILTRNYNNLKASTRNPHISDKPIEQTKKIQGSDESSIPIVAHGIFDPAAEKVNYIHVYGEHKTITVITLQLITIKFV